MTSNRLKATPMTNFHHRGPCYDCISNSKMQRGRVTNDLPRRQLNAADSARHAIRVGVFARRVVIAVHGQRAKFIALQTTGIETYVATDRVVALETRAKAYELEIGAYVLYQRASSIQEGKFRDPGRMFCARAIGKNYAARRDDDWCVLVVVVGDANEDMASRAYGFSGARRLLYLGLST